MVQTFKSVNSKWKLLNEQYFPVTLFTVQYISNNDSEQNPTMWLSQRGLGISRDRDDLMRAKIKTPKISRASNNLPPPPKKTKISSLKNSNSKKSFDHPCLLKPEYPHCGDYTSKLFLAAFSLGESGGSRLQKSGGVNSPTSLLS